MRLVIKKLQKRVIERLHALHQNEHNVPRVRRSMHVVVLVVVVKVLLADFDQDVEFFFIKAGARTRRKGARHAGEDVDLQQTLIRKENAIVLHLRLFRIHASSREREVRLERVSVQQMATELDLLLNFRLRVVEKL